MGTATIALLLAVCLPVTGDRITMGDIAAAIPAFAGLSPKEAIGIAPAPGAQRRFSAGELERLASRKGVSIEAAPVCFEREMASLTKERVIAALRASLPDGTQMELVEFSRMPVPKGLLEFPRTGLMSAPVGSPREAVIWRGRVTYANRQSMPVWAKVRVWISRTGVVAVQDLPVGKPIEAHQIRMESVDANPFLAGASGDVAGLTPRRRIASGQQIPRSAIASPVDVSRGEMVGVEAHYGAALLQFKARAEAAGRVGDSISIRNMESGKTFRARVVRKGLVAVK